ncbi:spore cortex-lytic enzyme [Alteribacillus sp. HJP-4]|uniref:spore cortex-lytic enzyme n=1 Tax=Alteribacillus sp. HJP-4 TaxID=2775394 RepID=UPI0035CCD69B
MFLVMAGLIMMVFQPAQAAAFSDQIIQKGATGDDVIELQARMQHNGFFNGKIDGVFGWGTYWAVKNFQEDFGIEVDGLVGDEMKQKLEQTTEYDEAFVKEALENGRKFTHYGGTPKDIQKGAKGSSDKGKSQGEKQQAPSGQDRDTAPEGKQDEQAPAPEQPEQGGGEGQPSQEAPQPAEPEEQDNRANIQKAMNVPEGYSENDIQLMANAVYGEARGEPYEGQVAVAAVIINRINSATFPNTAAGVIFEPRAFTAVADGQIYMTPNEEARKAVLDAINGQDPSDGAIYYFNPDTATSGWIWGRPQIKNIGKHVFCK